MKLYLLRHAHRGNGAEQDTLTPLGIEQAARTCRYLKTISFDKIICGEYKRCRRTADELIKDAKCIIEFTGEVNEQGLGDLEGKSGSEFKQALKESGLSEEDFRPKNGENRADLYSRAKKFFERLKKEESENILIVSHAGFIGDLITLLLKMPMGEAVNFKPSFAAISYFELDKDFRVKDFYINDLTHLAKEYKD